MISKSDVSIGKSQLQGMTENRLYMLCMFEEHQLADQTEQVDIYYLSHAVSLLFERVQRAKFGPNRKLETNDRVWETGKQRHTRI